MKPINTCPICIETAAIKRARLMERLWLVALFALALGAFAVVMRSLPYLMRFYQ